MTSGPLLELDAVEVSYGGAIRALSGVSVAVPAGAFVALIGANGAGKTTTLKAAANLLPVDRGAVTAGRISFEGEDVTHQPVHRLVRRGLVLAPEGRRCFRSLTVEENLITGALGRSSTRAEQREDLDKIYALFPRLTEVRRSPAGLVSGGEQQMVAIGRALASRPRVLLLDEPSMGLAPLVVEHIFRALKRLTTESGLAILVAEQNAAIALRHADRAVVLENGRTALEGDAKALAARGDVKAFYLGRAPSIETRVA
ncbi:ABC transporter ATP-binding protein [Hansschlegelia plantiphila]|uniref:ABC transporter ATP-binding protein n=1 Tax=Hansschlegelia plantiphila TaxID=374655 RepID=A0A9W6MWQ0_9HYPH|nr:ABC transporter ATP-binding protein [Hansschlegelia plantiphila]GLK69774.1 ABC transporter ATP-binding protein [Hansschlegelia plantiphila]